MSVEIDDLVAWASSRGVRTRTRGECRQHPAMMDRVAVLEELAPLDDAPAINFGRWQEAIPGAVVYPTTEADLVAVVCELAARSLRYTTRGRGHCSGDLGLARPDQILIDVSKLSVTSPLSAAPDSVSISAGATLEDLVDALAAIDRRPLGLTTNLAQSVGGTIAVGGFTESSHLHGLFADSMTKTRLVTTEGDLVEVEPGDPRFDNIPGSAGEHGIVTAVAMRSAKGRLRIAARMMRWRTFEDFLPDALRIAQLRLYGYFRPRLVARAEEIEAFVGNYVSDTTDADTGPSFLHASSVSPTEFFDLEMALRTAMHAPKPFACPAVELVFPIPSEELKAIEFARSSLTTLGAHLPRGIALALARGGSRFRHAPLPPTTWALMIAVRPELPPRDAVALVPVLRQVVSRTLEGSAAVRYRVSI